MQNLPPEVFQNIVLNMVTNGTTVCVDMARVCAAWGTACDDDILYQQALQVLKMPREAMKNVPKWKEHFNGVCREDKKLRDAKGWMRRGILAASLDWENSKFQLHTAMRRLGGLKEYPHLMWLMSARGGDAELAHQPVPNGSSLLHAQLPAAALAPWRATYPKYGPIAEWDVSNVTNMSEMFRGVWGFNSDLSKWDVSNVTNMSQMFEDATSFNCDLSEWDVSNVTTMSRMFEGATSFNRNLSKWGDKMSNVKSVMCMFEGATSFNGDLSEWDVSNVTVMSRMFNNATSFNRDLSKWGDKVSNVTDMWGMFLYATSFNGDISEWNVSKVKRMSRMFEGATSFNRNLSKWGDKVSNLIIMSYMFKDATSFNGDLSKWNLSNVKYTTKVFDGATNLERAHRFTSS